MSSEDISSPRFLGRRDGLVLAEHRLIAVLLLPFEQQVAAVHVAADDRREALDLEPLDRLGAEIFVGDDVKALHRLRKERARAADREEVDGLALLQRLLDDA